MPKASLLLATCSLSLAALYGSVCAREAYVQEHPMHGLQLKMMYCIDMTSTMGPAADVGCKVGWGNGKVGVKKDIVRQVVERLNKHKYSKAYKELVSSAGLHMTFHDNSVGSKGDVIVWEEASTGRTKVVVCKES